jgi:peptidoglycan/LPS O-acetylase OafA/YrhL
MEFAGPFCFGLVMGFVTHRTLRHVDQHRVSDIAAVLAAVGGGGIISLFSLDSGRFDTYAVGLAAGFVIYLVLALALPEGQTDKFLGSD